MWIQDVYGTRLINVNLIKSIKCCEFNKDLYAYYADGSYILLYEGAQPGDATKWFMAYKEKLEIK